MQPYFFPYIGYWQLIAAVDRFVVYDNVKYTKKGWINRNRILSGGHEQLISLPLKKGSDSLDIAGRRIADDFSPQTLLNQLQGAYRKAPYFRATDPLLQQIVLNDSRNLFDFLYAQIAAVCDHLDIGAELIVSSSLNIDHSLRAQDKVLAICDCLGAQTYINAIGGQALYAGPAFSGRGVDLRFLKSGEIAYEQFGAAFVPWLSIIDLLMFNSVETIKSEFLNKYSLI